MVELRAAPEAPIRYTTDGSDPKTLGGTYTAPFAVPPGTICVLAIAEKAGVQSEIHRRDITWNKKEELKLDLISPSPGFANTGRRQPKNLTSFWLCSRSIRHRSPGLR